MSARPSTITPMSMWLPAVQTTWTRSGANSICRILGATSRVARTTASVQVIRRAYDPRPITTPLLRRAQAGGRRALGRHHAVDQAPRPHGAGVDVEVVEDVVGMFLDRLLLRLQDQFVLAENTADAVAQLGG